MKYPNMPPSTLATVQIAANFKYDFGRMVVIAINNGSGGIGKNALSAKASPASALVAIFVWAHPTVQAYSR